MKWVFVRSKSVRSIGYDQENNQMGVEFTRGATYLYDDVSEGEFDLIYNSESIGKAVRELLQYKQYTQI